MEEEDRVRVRFYTQHVQYVVTDAPFAVPSKLGRYGLSEVINHLLELESPIPFDFLISGQLLRVSLKSFIRSHRLSVEDVISVEYIPAVSLSAENENVELPSWIGSLNTKLDNYILAGCYDGQLQILDSKSLKKIQSISAHQHPIRDLVSWINTNNNSKVIATASKDHKIHCWELLEDSKSQVQLQCPQVARLIGHVNSVECIQYWTSKQILVSGDWAGTIALWSVSSLGTGQLQSDTSNQSLKKKKKSERGTPVAGPVVELSSDSILKAHMQAVTGIQITSQEILFSSSWDHSIKAWDMDRQDCIATFNSSKVITSISYSDPTRLLASSHPDGRVRLWDARQQEATSSKGSFTHSKSWIAEMQWHPTNENIFASVDYDGMTLLWDVRTPVVLGKREAHSGKGLSLAWSAASEDGQHGAVTGGSDCCVSVTHLT